MSRVIKFRAWHKKDKWMESGDDFYIRADGAIFEPSKRTYDTPNAEIESSDDFILMQFTGLYDVNGVEIYESDVVSMWYAPQAKCKGAISFTDGCFVFETNEAKPLSCPAHDCVNKHGNFFTVIGNVHQNPELLGPKP